MTSRSVDNFIEQYLARHAGPQHGFGLPIWLSWVLALIVAGSTLLCMRVGEPVALVPTWTIALALAAVNVFAWRALAASAVLSCLGYVAMYLLDPGLNRLSLELLILGALAAFAGLLIGRAAHLKAQLRHERHHSDLLRQLCRIWAQSDGSCLKEIDLHGRLQAMAPEGMLVMGVCDFETLRGADWLGFWQGDAAAPARLAFEQASTGKFSRFSGFCPTVAGTPKWWDVLLLPVHDSRGRVESILSLSWDVTDLKSGTEALRVSNTEYRNLLDVLDDGFYRLDRNWRFVQANARAESILGQGESVIGKTLDQLFPELRASEFGVALIDAMDHGFPRHLEWQSQRFNGWYRVSVYPRADGVSVFFSDITVNVTTIRNLQTTKARLRLSQEVGRFADWTYHLDQRRMELSEQALQLLGLEAGETSEVSLLGRLHPDDRLALVTALLDVTEGGKALDLIVRITLNNATEPRYFHFAGAEVRPLGQSAGLIVGSVHDVTEQQARERHLLEAQAFTRGIIDALPQAVAVLDERGLVIAGNRSWRAATPAAVSAPFGLEQGHDYLAFCRELSAAGNEAAQALLEGIEALLEGIGGPLRLEYAVSVNGATHRFQAFATLLGNNNSQIVLVHEDITEAVQLKAALAQQTQRLKLVNEGSNDGIWEWMPASNSLYVSERFVELTGYSLDRQEDFAEWLVAHAYPGDAEVIAAGWDTHLEQGTPLDVEWRLQTARGARWFRIRGKAEWAGDVLLRVAGSLMDINEQRDLLERIQVSETRFREMVEHLPHVFWEYDVASARLTYLSPALEKVLGMSPQVVYEDQDAWLRLVHPSDLSLAECFKHKALIEHLAAEVEFRTNTPAGAEVWIRDRSFPFTDADGKVVRMVGIAENITEARTFENKLFEAANFDRVTGLPNRDMFLKRLSQQCVQASSEDPSFLVLSVGFDRIKWVQQVLGQGAKDELMRQLGVHLGKGLQGCGYLARLGSEHFGVLLSRSDELAHAAESLNELLVSFSEPFKIAGEVLKLNAFIGIARFPEHGASAEFLLNNAQAAAYAVAQSGHSSHAHYDPCLLENDLNALRLEAGLELALERSEFVLHYQPKVNLADGQVCGAEALIRWAHPEHGLISPLHFVPLLEETGLIVPVGLWCIDHALAQLVRWQAQGLEHIVMAVNLSIRQLRPELVDHLSRALALHGVRPECMELELTESIMHGDQAATEVVYQLKKLGVRVAVDDFGTGYATLGSLRSFVPDVVKIDKSFLQQIVSEPADQAIVRSVIDMGHALGMSVVAEGVEHEAQREILEKMHCDQIQGYLISPPVEAQTFTERYVR